MDWTGIRIETTRHARDRFRERLGEYGPPGRELILLLLKSEPRHARDEWFVGVPEATTRHLHPSGIVLAVDWITATVARIVTVFRLVHVQEGAA